MFGRCLKPHSTVNDNKNKQNEYALMLLFILFFIRSADNANIRVRTINYIWFTYIYHIIVTRKYIVFENKWIQ